MKVLIVNDKRLSLFKILQLKTKCLAHFYIAGSIFNFRSRNYIYYKGRYVMYTSAFYRRSNSIKSDMVISLLLV